MLQYDKRQLAVFFGKTVAIQLGIIIGLFFGLKLLFAAYGMIDTTVFPEPYVVTATSESPETEKGKALLDALTANLRRELDSGLGWTANDLAISPTSPYLLDNRAARQLGVWHATKVLTDFYSLELAKLGSNDKENANLNKARMNYLAINPQKFWILPPGAGGAYEDGLKLMEKYKADLDNGKAVFNTRTDDLYAMFALAAGDNLLGYAIGLLQGSHNMSAWELDNRIYEVQGVVLVLRDFLNAIYVMYPEIRQKNNEENMQIAFEYMNIICTYDPMFITSMVNSGEFITANLLVIKNRIEDTRNSIRM